MQPQSPRNKLLRQPAGVASGGPGGPSFQALPPGHRFTLTTDHASLTWMLNFCQPEGQVARWLEILQEYDFEVQH